MLHRTAMEIRSQDELPAGLDPQEFSIPGPPQASCYPAWNIHRQLELKSIGPCRSSQSNDDPNKNGE